MVTRKRLIPVISLHLLCVTLQKFNNDVINIAQVKYFIMVNNCSIKYTVTMLRYRKQRNGLSKQHCF